LVGLDADFGAQLKRDVVGLLLGCVKANAVFAHATQQVGLRIGSPMPILKPRSEYT
jgi:hypothetical protein